MFSQKYRVLVERLLDQLKTHLPEPAFKALIADLARAIADEFRSELSRLTLQARMNRLIEILEREGFIAEWQITEDGIRLIHGIDLSVESGKHLALVGFSGSGKSTLAQCIGQLYKYTGGSVLIGQKEVSDLTKADMVHNIGFVAQAPFIFDGTIEENLLYSCNALREGDGDRKGDGLPSLDDQIEVLQQTGVFPDVLRFGLNALLDPKQYKDLGPLINRVRERFQRDFGEALADYVEFFNEDKYILKSKN